MVPTLQSTTWAAGPRPWRPNAFSSCAVGGIMEVSQGTFSIDVRNVLTDDDVVVVLAVVNAQRNGVSASFPEVHVWRMRNGKAIEFREYQGDEEREDRFWS